MDYQLMDYQSIDFNNTSWVNLFLEIIKSRILYVGITIFTIP